MDKISNGNNMYIYKKWLSGQEITIKLTEDISKIISNNEVLNMYAEIIIMQKNEKGFTLLLDFIGDENILEENIKTNLIFIENIEKNNNGLLHFSILNELI